MKKILFKIIKLLDELVPKDNKMILYYSFPDVSDNAFSLYIYMAENNTSYKNIWIIEDFSDIDRYVNMIKNYTSSTNYQFIKKNSLKAVYYYLRSKFVIITHNIYRGVEISNNHIIINVWHGMHLKKIGLMDGKKAEDIQKQVYITVTSNYFKEILFLTFGTNRDNILITGQPRNDLLFENKNMLSLLNIHKENYSKILLWMPTYRESITGEIRVDGKKTDHGLPVLSSKELKEFNLLLEKLNMLCILKIHPMDSLTGEKIIGLKNFKIISSNDLLNSGIQLNTLLSEVDAMISDYSGVFVDFLLLNRPLILLANDIDEYKKTRGFIEEDIRNLMPVNFTESYKELEIKIYQIYNNKFDIEHKNKQLFNEVNSNFSENIYKNIIKKYV